MLKVSAADGCTAQGSDSEDRLSKKKKLCKSKKTTCLLSSETFADHVSSIIYLQPNRKSSFDKESSHIHIYTREGTGETRLITLFDLPITRISYL